HVVSSFARTGKPEDWSRAGHDGQIWSYDPRTSTLRLRAFFPRNASPSGTGRDVPDGPDNITAGPAGSLMVAEDGAGAQHLVAVSAGGRKAVFARNALSGSELTGVCFSPDGRTLFVNIQGDGLTLAISGPFGPSPGAEWTTGEATSGADDGRPPLGPGGSSGPEDSTDGPFAAALDDDGCGCAAAPARPLAADLAVAAAGALALRAARGRGDG